MCTITSSTHLFFKAGIETDIEAVIETDIEIGINTDK